MAKINLWNEPLDLFSVAWLIFDLIMEALKLQWEYNPQIMQRQCSGCKRIAS